jgi:hypothetical protein
MHTAERGGFPAWKLVLSYQLLSIQLPHTALGVERYFVTKFSRLEAWNLESQQPLTIRAIKIIIELGTVT